MKIEIDTLPSVGLKERNKATMRAKNDVCLVSADVQLVNEARCSRLKRDPRRLSVGPG
jgi:hypothetical protein